MDCVEIKIEPDPQLDPVVVVENDENYNFPDLELTRISDPTPPPTVIPHDGINFSLFELRNELQEENNIEGQENEIQEEVQEEIPVRSIQERLLTFVETTTDPTTIFSNSRNNVKKKPKNRKSKKSRRNSDPPPTFFTCVICWNKFDHPADLNRHVIKKHDGRIPITTSILTSKPVKKPQIKICIICGDIYDSHRKLVIHKKQKHPEKSFDCLYCTKKFHSKTSLRQHQVVHKTIL